MHRVAALPLAAAIMLSTPALADHAIGGTGVSNSGPVVTLSAEMLPAGELSGGVGVSVTEPDAYTDAELISLASQHVHAHTTDYNMSAAASLSYGLPGHVTVSAKLPFIVRDDLRAGHHSHSGGAASNTVEQLGTVSGAGDLSLMAHFQLAHDHAEGSFVALLGGLKVPTGSTHETNASRERLETEHQPGTGSWDPLFGLAASKGWEAWSVHTSALYHLSTKGAQETELGDRTNLAAAVVYDLSAQSHEHEQAAEHHHDGTPHSRWALMFETNYEWEGRQVIAGVVEDESGSEAIWLSPGIRFSAPGGWSAAVSAGLPIWQDVGLSHPQNDFRLVAQIGTAF